MRIVRRARSGATSLFALVTAGCGTANLSPELAPFGGGQVNPAGANTLIRFTAPRVTAADLAAQICPSKGDTYRRPQSKGSANPVADDPLSDAIACFGAEAEAEPNDARLKLRRNGVTTYLLLRSDQACHLWMTYLERMGAVNRGVFNVASVVAGGVGALVSGDASRALAGTSGIASGAGAAVDAALMHGMTEGLIVPRVIAERERRHAIIETKLDEDLVRFPMGMAISNALDYHAACNVSAALRETTPGAAFGRELDLLTQNSSRILAAKAALENGHPPTLADVKAGSIFLVKGEVLVVDAIDATTGKVTYSIVGVANSQTAVADRQALLDRASGGLTLRTS